MGLSPKGVNTWHDKGLKMAEDAEVVLFLQTLLRTHPKSLVTCPSVGCVKLLIAPHLKYLDVFSKNQQQIQRLS